LQLVFICTPLMIPMTEFLQAEAIAPMMAGTSKTTDSPKVDPPVTEIPPKEDEDEAMDRPTTEIQHDGADSEEEYQEIMELQVCTVNRTPVPGTTLNDKQGKINEIIARKRSRRPSTSAVVKKEESPTRKRRKSRAVTTDVVMIDLTSD
jgi:hypothetical protein